MRHFGEWWYVELQTVVSDSGLTNKNATCPLCTSTCEMHYTKMKIRQTIHKKAIVFKKKTVGPAHCGLYPDQRKITFSNWQVSHTKSRYFTTTTAPPTPARTLPPPTPPHPPPTPTPSHPTHPTPPPPTPHPLHPPHPHPSPLHTLNQVHPGPPDK